MHIQPIKIPRLEVPSTLSIEEVLASSLETITSNSILAISSKIVAVCEDAVLPVGQTDYEALVRSEADLYLDPSESQYGHHFTIKGRTLIASAGIDKSNASDHYILWPRDPQASANRIRKWLSEKYGVERVGVLITDSTSYALRRGATGVAIAHSGFRAVNSYVGKRDLFGRELQVEAAGVANGLAAATVLAMGEGDEQTPLCVVTEVPFVEFVEVDPTESELDDTYLRLEEDLFAPFLSNAPWKNHRDV